MLHFLKLVEDAQTVISFSWFHQLMTFSLLFFFYQESANSEVEQYRTMVMGRDAQRGSSDAKQQNKQSG